MLLMIPNSNFLRQIISDIQKISLTSIIMTIMLLYAMLVRSEEICNLKINNSRWHYRLSAVINTTIIVNEMIDLPNRRLPGS